MRCRSHLRCNGWFGLRGDSSSDRRLESVCWLLDFPPTQDLGLFGRGAWAALRATGAFDGSFEGFCRREIFPKRVGLEGRWCPNGSLVGYRKARRALRRCSVRFAPQDQPQRGEAYRNTKAPAQQRLERVARSVRAISSRLLDGPPDCSWVLLA
jgi:hypothetical protein